MILPPFEQEQVRIMATAHEYGDIVIDHVDCKAIGRLTITDKEGDGWIKHIIDAWHTQVCNWN